MEKEFWDEAWRDQRIGFHQSATNNQLSNHFPLIYQNSRPKNTLVPLCGKSLDLLWLAKNCEQVTGIEFSKRAIEDFFNENQLTIEETGHINEMPYFRSDNITIIQGDFLKFETQNRFDFIFDRAAIVALDPTTRAQYCQKITDLSSEVARILMITFEYDQTKIKGPPFCVSEEKIHNFYKRTFRIEILHQKSERPKSPRFLEAQVDSFTQKTYLLSRRIDL